MIPFADVIFFSRDFIHKHDFESAREWISNVFESHDGTKVNSSRPWTIVVPWGDVGAFGQTFGASFLFAEFVCWMILCRRGDAFRTSSAA